MNYYIKEINSCESRILDKIDIIKKYGIDTSSYESSLNSIIKNTKEVENVNGVALAKMTNEAYNIETLKKLQELEKELDSYQIYLKIYFRNSSLYNDASNSKTLSNDKIRFYVNEVIAILNETLDYDFDSISKAKKIIKEVYNTIYLIIKLELLNSGESTLLTYIKNNNQGIEYINDLVREELSQLASNDKQDDEIKELIMEINKNGINYSYADENLILLLALKNESLVLNNFANKIAYYEQIINDLSDCILKQERLKIEKEDSSDNQHKQNKRDRRKALLSSAMLALNLLTYKILPEGLKEAHTVTTYPITIEAYDTISDTVHRENFISPTKRVSEYTEVTVYGEVNNSGYRKVVTYDLSKKQAEDIKSYIDMFDEKNDWHSSNDKKYRLTEQLSREEYTTVEKLSYGEPIEDFDEEKYQEHLNRDLMIIYALGGLNTAAMLTYLLKALHGRKKYKQGLKEFKQYDSKIDEYRDEIRDYSTLKSELNQMKDKYLEEGLSSTEYKKIYKK